MPDDIYLINKAKTEFREGYNNSNVDQVLSVFDEFLIEMSQGEPSAFGEESKARMRRRLATLFAEYDAKIVPIIIDVIVAGSTAYDFGWHELTLAPKAGGQPLRQRLRYLEHWKKNAAGEWKITLFLSNEDRKEVYHGMEPRWFISEERAAAN